MQQLKQLIIAVQVMTPIVGAARIGYLMLINLHEAEKNPMYKKIKNTLMAIIMIEFVLYTAAMIKGYYSA